MYLQDESAVKNMHHIYPSLFHHPQRSPEKPRDTKLGWPASLRYIRPSVGHMFVQRQHMKQLITRYPVGDKNSVLVHAIHNLGVLECLDVNSTEEEEKTLLCTQLKMTIMAYILLDGENAQPKLCHRLPSASCLALGSYKRN